MPHRCQHHHLKIFSFCFKDMPWRRSTPVLMIDTIKRTSYQFTSPEISPKIKNLEHYCRNLCPVVLLNLSSLHISSLSHIRFITTHIRLSLHIFGLSLHVSVLSLHIIGLSLRMSFLSLHIFLS